MRNIILAYILVSLIGANLAPVVADEVAKGKVPFMTELGSGKKFYVARQRTAPPVAVVKTHSSKRVQSKIEKNALSRKKLL